MSAGPDDLVDGKELMPLVDRYLGHAETCRSLATLARSIARTKPQGGAARSSAIGLARALDIAGIGWTTLATIEAQDAERSE